MVVDWLQQLECWLIGLVILSSHPCWGAPVLMPAQLQNNIVIRSGSRISGKTTLIYQESHGVGRFASSHVVVDVP